MKNSWSRKAVAKGLLCWLFVAVELERSLRLGNLTATPDHPMTAARLPVAWTAVMFTTAAAYFLFTHGWRNPLVWMGAGLGAVNFLALLAPSDGIAVGVGLLLLAAATGLAFAPAIGPRAVLVLARSLLPGLASSAAGMALSPPYADICSRAAPWICKLAGALLLASWPDCSVCPSPWLPGFL
ncbi:MAG: hypothetical protein ACUVS7_16405 [Bryobacteraceae bacterium]